MIRLLRKLTSLKALTRAQHLADRRGQIATVILLAIVGLLIMTLMVANLGQASLAATNITNAADASALLLGSQLATKSHQLWVALGYDEEHCEPGGWLGTILAVLLAILVLFVPFFAEAGGLLAYGPSFVDPFRRAASYVDRILKGAQPGQLPVQRPTKFELLINLKAAKALGLKIPLSLLQRADQVIE